MSKNSKLYIFTVSALFLFIFISVILQKQSPAERINDEIIDLVESAFNSVHDLENSRYQLTNKDDFLKKYDQTLVFLDEIIADLKNITDTEYSRPFRLSAVELLEALNEGLVSENYKRIVELTFNDNQLTDVELREIDKLRYELDIKARVINQKYLDEQRTFAHKSDFRLIDGNLSVPEIPETSFE